MYGDDLDDPAPALELEAEFSSSLQGIEYGYGWLLFAFDCPRWGRDHLQIDADRFCSRQMSVRSGQGPPEITSLDKCGVEFRFGHQLAQSLELARRVRFQCELSNEEQSIIAEFLSLPDH